MTCMSVFFAKLMIASALFSPSAAGIDIIAVDMGLSVKWSSANLGATEQEGAGDYYAWGEINAKTEFNWETYKWGKFSYTKSNFTKYNHLSRYGVLDYLSRLETIDDVAHMKLGGDWRIPTIDELIELFSTWRNADYRWEWIDENEHCGWSVTYLVNGNTIFLPAARRKGENIFIPEGVPFGSYWSSDLSTGSSSSSAKCLEFQKSPGRFEVFLCERCSGLQVRPVCGPRVAFQPVSDFKIAAVDIGLSVKWANSNLGATAPEGYGDYYAWGETRSKKTYSWKNYKWCNGTHDSLTKYNTSTDFGKIADRSPFSDSDDAAHVILGGKWRLPSISEIDELLATRENADYKWEWKTINGQRGWTITYLGNGNSIFIPAAGYRQDDNYVSFGEAGLFWCKSINSESPDKVICFHYDQYSTDKIYAYRSFGIPIRPVTE